MPQPTALAIAAHPDDIEFMMAGTMLRLADAGFALHVMNLADGCCGSVSEDRAATAARRAQEAQDAAAALGAVWHAPIAHDMEIVFSAALLRKVAAVVRQTVPEIVLTHYPEDYMEDHMNACRLAVTAAFTLGMPNFETDPPVRAANAQVRVYHAMPHILSDGIGRPVHPDRFVDIAPALERKRAALGCHRSQKEWLDASQGLDSLFQGMERISRKVGEWSGVFAHAEGWRRHNHVGYCAENFDPLAEALGSACHIAPLD